MCMHSNKRLRVKLLIFLLFETKLNRIKRIHILGILNVAINQRLQI